MINILYCGNDKVFDGILTSAISVLKRTSTTEAFSFYIFTMDVSYINESYNALSKEQSDFLDKAVKKYNPENRVVRIDVLDIYKSEFDATPNEHTSYSPYAMLRLLADLVADMPKKLLYLDVDTLACKDILALYSIDISGVEYAAARDHYGKFLINPNYINSGVLLLNLEMIKETGLFKKARDVLKVKKLLFPDQSAIRLNTTKRKMISQRFNDQKFLYKNTVIRHFSKRLFWFPYPHVENVKQWHVERVRKVFKYSSIDDILEEYLQLKSEFNKENTK